MTFDQLSQYVSEISEKMYAKGMRELLATQSASMIAEYSDPLYTHSYIDIPKLFLPFLDTPDPTTFHQTLTDLSITLNQLSTGNHADGAPDDRLTQSDLASSDTSDGTGFKRRGDHSQDSMLNAKFPHDAHLANTKLAEMARAGKLLSRWEGLAAQEFQKNFITPFDGLVRNQYTAVLALSEVVRTEQDIWRRVRHDIIDIAKKTIKALDSLPGNSCSPTTWTVSLTVVAAVTGVIATIPTLGTSTVLTLAALGGAASTVAAFPHSEPVPSTIRGGDVFQIFDSVTDAVHQEITLLNTTEDWVARWLKAVLDSTHSSASLFVAPRPALADATRSTITNDYNMGYAR